MAIFGDHLTMLPCSQEHVWSHVERGGVRSCSWSLACQVRRNLGASRWHHWIGIRKSEGKDEFEALPIAGPNSRFSIAPLHLYSRPSMSTIPWSEVWPYSFMLAVTFCATPNPAYNHQFFSSHPRTRFSFKPCFPSIHWEDAGWPRCFHFTY